MNKHSIIFMNFESVTIDFNLNRLDFGIDFIILLSSLMQYAIAE